MKRQLSVALLLSLAVGCVFPSHFADKEPFREEVIGFIEPGETSKSEIALRLGEPRARFLQGRWWVFHASQKKTGWTMLSSSGTEEWGGRTQEYDLVVGFDEYDVVTHSAIVTPDSPCDLNHIVCYSNGLLSLPAGIGEAVPHPAANCTVILYPSRPPGPHTAVWISLDEHEEQALFAGYDVGYLYQSLEPGFHNIGASIPSYGFAETLSVNCQPKETTYLSVLIDQDDVVSFQLMSPEKGIEEVSKREPFFLPNRGTNQRF